MKVVLDPEDLRPIIREVVREVREEFEAERQKLGEQLAFAEPEAATLIGVPWHVLRDCRLRGEISGRRVSKRTIYSRQELLAFLESSKKPT